MMSRYLAILGVAAAVLSAAVTYAQGGPGMRMPRYDKTTETTLTGTVEEVQAHQGRAGGTGTHLMLMTDEGSVDVHVGPTNWLARQKFEFAKGDQLQVLGSRVKVDGKDGFIAREITKGDSKMVLRDEAGFPLWSGGRRGMRP